MTLQKTQRLTLLALFSVLIIAFTVIPYVGYIAYIPGLAEITTIHILVIIGAMLVGPTFGAALGGVWGVSSWVRAWVLSGTQGYMIYFQHPELLIIPRICVGFVAGGLALALSQKSKWLSLYVPAVLGTLTNTVLFLSYYILITGGTDHILSKFISYAITLNGGVELALAIIIVPPVVLAVQRAYGRNMSLPG